MRGKADLRQLFQISVRITPACAGKSAWLWVDVDFLGDHPRVCGEKDCVREAINQLTGSPPRVRGKEWFRDENLQQPGITPACAGKSVKKTSWIFVVRDHPRVCGEKSK